MKLLVRVHFSSEGSSPVEVARRVKQLGFSPLLGDYDFVFDLADGKEYSAVVQKLHDALKGSHVRYTLATKK